MNISMKSETVTQGCRLTDSGRSHRTGMALLFVISLILFITLLGASFVVVSTQFSKSAKTRARIEARGDSSRANLYRAFYDLVRGPESTNTFSPLRGHDILSDIYGFGVRSDTGTVVSAGAIAGSLNVQFLNAFSVVNNAAVALSVADDAYNGLVLTFVNGQARGISCRVIDYDTSTAPPTFTVIPEQGIPSTLLPASLNGSTVLLNGRPFSGWGAGGVAGPASGLEPNALLPRLMNDSTSINSSGLNGIAIRRDSYYSSGINESYDAADYQNMYLAMIDGTGFHASFNRPQLFTYVEANSLIDEEKYTNFRPVTSTYLYEVATTGGGNPDNIPVQSSNGWASPLDALDVDNDGDGNPDSVWMDLGYPVQTDIDGRRYKPLVAVMVLDMDSRLNVNANGNGFHLNRNVNFAGNLIGEIDPTAQELPRGQYLGPPEVSLGPLVGNNAAVYGYLLTSRFGSDNLPGIGHWNAEANVNIDFRDSWLVYENFGYPDVNHFWGETYPNQFVGGQFGTNLDVHGRYTIGIPQVGLVTDTPIARPAIDAITNFTEPANEIASSAYEFSLFPQSRFPITTTDASDDQPFSPKEMERYLRRFDRDSKMLPSRLFGYDDDANIATPDVALIDPALTPFFSTNSVEVPALPSLENVAGLPASVVETIHGLLVNSGNTSAAANVQLNLLLAPEVRLGLPMDLNRPFGNGRDDSPPVNGFPGNGVYDEHWQTTDSTFNPIPGANAFDESIIGEQIADVQGAFVSLDSDADGAFANTHLARQIFARQLYVLALLATGDTSTIIPDFAFPYGDETARRISLAQWAVNVVDFRDSDSINTPFEIDVNPFNLGGWSVDGWLGVGPSGDDTLFADRFVVWGVERPELLITESLVTHDRRTQNLDAGDPEFESQLVPRASAFIELYHPWNQNDSNQLLPAELADGSALIGVDLRKTVASTSDPVWRLLVIRDTSLNLDPDSATIPESDIARKVYFVQPSIAIDPDERAGLGAGKAYTGQKVYYSSFDNLTANGVITRGGYAVIGSSGVGTDTVATDGVTFFGRRVGGGWVAELDQTRRVDLDGPGRQVTVYEPNDGTNGTSTQNRTDVAAIIIDQPRSLGFSDPDDGYASLGIFPPIPIEDGYAFSGQYASPADSVDPYYSQFTMLDGVADSFSDLYLQRLANPLAPYDPVTNPYLTVDSKPLDLIAFNGVEDDSPADPSVTPTDMVFAAAERGRLGDSLYDGVSQPALNRRWLWTSAEGGINLATASTQFHFQTVLDNHIHSFNLYESLGGINGSYSDETTARFPRAVPSDLNSPDVYPPVAFTGLTWNNRPFAGHMDLLDVPFRNSYDLLINHTRYDTSAPTSLYDANSDVQEFGHLFNFFTEPDAAFPRIPRRLSALLDYVRVPSRFAGTRTHLNSALPPFNILSRYREPGKINLNTISDVDNTGLPGNSPVWEGLMGVHATGLTANGQLMDTSAATYGFDPIDVGVTGFEGARRGVAGTGISVFDNPFRTASEFEKVPVGGNILTEAVQATLLRSEIANRPLFDYPVVSTRELPFANPIRDAASRHEVFRKLANTTTTRSSVFSIWITVGKFEVDEQGLLLGPNLIELGSDTGKAERSRGFFMIDRSIPVGYEPGKNHNIENMILVETIIQ